MSQKGRELYTIIKLNNKRFEINLDPNNSIIFIEFLNLN